MRREGRQGSALLALLALTALVAVVGARFARRRCAGGLVAEEPARLAAQALTESAPTAAPEGPIPAAIALPEVLIDPALLIEKRARRLSVLSAGAIAKRYELEVLGEPEGAKRRAGDARTPEGAYYVCAKPGAPVAPRSLAISYPGAHDADAALTEGAITPREHRAILSELRRMGCPPMRTALGGGMRLLADDEGSHALDGGFALAAADLDELLVALPLGTPVEIAP